MRKTSDLQVTKIFTISIFIFLAGLFAGLFFSTGISDENSAYLSGVLISSISDPSSGFFKTFFSSLISDLLLCAIMMISVFSKFLCPIVSVSNISVTEYAQSNEEDKSQKQAHYCSLFYFFHFLSPPKRSSKVSGS